MEAAPATQVAAGVSSLGLETVAKKQSRGRVIVPAAKADLATKVAAQASSLELDRRNIVNSFPKLVKN